MTGSLAAMSDPGLSSFPADQAAAVPPRKSAPTGAIIAVVVVVLALIAGGLVAAWALLKDDKDKQDYPKAWDSRIAPYVKIVEKERGLTFKHPVAVRFLEPAAFEKTLKTEEKDLDKDERAEIDQVTALFRAFGLIAGDVDLFDAFNDAYGSGTLAYYSFEDERITVRGTTLVLASHATLVHELTHALQDQRFDIGDRLEDLSEAADDGAVSTAYDALDAIVEGDAERVADLYRKSLTSKEQQALSEAEDADQGDDVDALAKIPKVVVTLIGAPYALGQALTEAVAEDDDDAIDDLFTDPPTNDSVLVDPMTALSGDTEATEVEVPKAEDGEKKVDSGQIGALTTYLMLAERIPLPEALAATDGWDGDAYLAFERGGTTCARVTYAGHDAQDVDRLETALQRWVDAVPGSPAKVARDGDRIVFESCDTGTAAKLGNDASQQALELIATRAYLGVGVLQAGLSAEAAGCFARTMIEEFPIADLQDATFGAKDPAIVKKIQQIVAACR
jgi:hypothetical protein